MRAVCAGCALRSVRGARCARESLAGRDMRAYGAGKAAEPPTAQQLDSKEPQWDKFQDYLKGEVRFASVAKQFPKEADELFLAARARLFRRRSGERPVAIQELPPHAGYSMVRFVTLAAVTNPTSACWEQLGNN